MYGMDWMYGNLNAVREMYISCLQKIETTRSIAKTEVNVRSEAVLIAIELYRAEKAAFDDSNYNNDDLHISESYTDKEHAGQKYNHLFKISFRSVEC